MRKTTGRVCGGDSACVRNVHRLRIEPVSESANVEEVARGRRVVFQLSAQADDVVVDDAVVQGHVGAPGGIEELLAGEEAPAI